MTHPDRWRLDQLLAWDEKHIAPSGVALGALVTSGQEEVTFSDLLP